MSKAFAMVPLGDLLIPTSRPEIVEPDKIYRILGAHWYAEGLYIKETKFGSEIQADKVYRIEQGDFVYNRLFAWKGSFAVATEKDNDCYVSNEFPSFSIDRDKVSAQYLQRYFCRASAWDEALGLSSGGTPTSRNRLKEDKLLFMRIPLPPLKEQQRIVARIEELAAKIEEAQRSHQEALEKAEGLMARNTSLLFKKLMEQYSVVWPLEKSATIVGGGTPSKADYALWQGTIPWVSPKDMKLNDIYDTEDHISNLALERSASTLIPQNSVLIVVRSGILRRTLPVSINRVPVTINQDMKALIPLGDLSCDFLAWWFRSQEPAFLENVKGGTTVQSLMWDRVKKFVVPVPPLFEQRHIVSYLDNLQSKIDILTRKQAEISAELNAILPSILDKAFKGEL